VAKISDSPAIPTPVPVKPNDILGLRYDSDVVQSFAPLYLRREFWYAQGALGLVLLGFLGLKMRRPLDTAVRLAAELRREKMSALSRLRSEDLCRVEFFETAARVVQIETALSTGRPAASIDAATARASAKLNEEGKATIDEVFAARAELLYAGGGSGEGRVSAQQRERVLALLGELEKGHDRR
jgi:hypothetical protein